MKASGIVALLMMAAPIVGAQIANPPPEPRLVTAPIAPAPARWEPMPAPMRFHEDGTVERVHYHPWMGMWEAPSRPRLPLLARPMRVSASLPVPPRQSTGERTALQLLGELDRWFAHVEERLSELERNLSLLERDWAEARPLLAAVRSFQEVLRNSN